MNWQAHSMPVRGSEALTPEIAVFRRYGPELRRYCHHYVREPQDMNDLAQEVHLRLQKMAAQPSAQIAAPIFGKPSQGSAADTAQGASAGQLDLQQQLKQALSEISPMHAAVLLLHRRDGLSQEAIAVELRLDVAVVAKYLAEARAQIRMKIWK